jgi:hypothetical protein
MKQKISFFFLVILILAGILQAGELELQLSYGRWSLAPFKTAVERETEKLIREEIQLFLSPIFPGNELPVFSPRIDLSSSGYFFSVALWYNFSNSPFSIGVKSQYINFTIPYSASVEQSFVVFGLELAKVDAHGEGDMKLNSIGASILGRWAFVLQPRLRVSVFGGLNFFPYKGTLSIDGQISLSSKFGDFSYRQSDSFTLSEIREWNDHVPSLLIAPELGFCLQYKFARRIGALLEVSVSQGVYLSVGLFFTKRL